ncbi:MAG: hypothetical protein JZU47_05715 [Prolixibacteraceae bacterium]|nr:hypothetical protein [Prolixibacteraceae bacterium]
MKKRLLLLAVSCKTGGLCPGGLDLDDPSKWIRIVRDDGHAGAVQGHEIDFAKPLDIIDFDGRPMPQGKQQENWVIDNNTCKKNGSRTHEALDWAYQQYAYKGFWGNYKAYLNEQEFAAVSVPSESIMKVSNVRIYTNDNDKAKIDFDWSGARYRIKWISMTDQDFYDRIKEGEVTFDNAYIVTSIPKEIDEWVNPNTGEKQAYKFVSKIYEI